MKISIQCQCGKQYQVKPELAGKKVKCQACGTPISVPAAAEPAAESKPKKAAAPAAKATSPAKAPAAAAAKPGAAKPAAAKPAAAARPAAKAAAAPAAPKIETQPQAPRHSILDEHMASAVRLPNPGEMYCPGCNAIIQSAAVICVSCGYAVQAGRNTRVSSEANKVKRKPGQMPGLGYLVALVAILYGLAGGAFFTLCIVLSGIILVKVGLPNSENGESATAMFGLPVHILLSTAGLLMFVSGIGILRYTKGATLNAGLGAKIYFWTLMLLMVLSVGNAIYKTTDRYKEAATKAQAQVSLDKKPPAPVELGHAKRLTASELLGLVTFERLAAIIGLFSLLLGPPAFVWAWASTQGRKWDWELPEPLHKLKLKPTAKVGGPQPEAEKK